MNPAEVAPATDRRTDPNGARMTRMRRIIMDFSGQDDFSKSEHVRLVEGRAAARARPSTGVLISPVSI